MKEKSFYLNDPSKIFYEVIEPEGNVNNKVIVMIHGAWHTGACYKTKPDGENGWAYYFSERGYKIYIVDWPGAGRSGYVPMDKINSQFIISGLHHLILNIVKAENNSSDIILLTHSMSGPFGWKLGEILGENIKAIIGIAPGEMGNIQVIPPILSENEDKICVDFFHREFCIDFKNPIIPSELRPLVMKKLVGGGNQFPINFLENYINSLQVTSPYALYERLNIKGSQLKINDFSPFLKTKILVVTGEYDIDHPKDTDFAIVKYFRKHHIAADFLYLPDVGVMGNGHMMMLEKNSNQIAHKLIEWIENN